MIPAVRPADALWKQGAGYYNDDLAELKRRPLLPDLDRVRDRRIFELFQRHANLQVGSRVLEIGCGRSRWLPLLGMRLGCDVSGIDIEPFASELARANLAGAGVAGKVFCRDGFRLQDNADLIERYDLVYSMGVLEHFDDVVDRVRLLSRYLRPGGRLLTTVPNMRGINWVLQRLGSREILEMHVVYDRKRLRRVHEAAGLTTLAHGYAGYFDGYLSSAGATPRGARIRAHGLLCRAASLTSELCLRAGRGALTFELPWCSPHVYCIGERAR